jgi:hypothetical protein
VVALLDDAAAVHDDYRPDADTARGNSEAAGSARLTAEGGSRFSLLALRQTDRGTTPERHFLEEH